MRIKEEPNLWVDHACLNHLLFDRQDLYLLVNSSLCSVKTPNKCLTLCNNLHHGPSPTHKMPQTLCAACQELLKERFAPSTTASCLSLSSYTHEANTCSLRSFIENDDNNTKDNDLVPSVDTVTRLSLDQWDNIQSPGMLFARARLVEIPQNLLLQVVVPRLLVEKPDSSPMIVFCQAGSKYMFNSA